MTYLTYEEYSEEETDCILLGVGLGVEENSLADVYKITFGYDKYSLFLKFIEGKKHRVVRSEFNQDVTVNIAIPTTDTNFTNKLTDYFLGQVNIVKENQTFVVFED